ncbi:MAG: hypothetical protein AAFV88_17755, partial [Planctomycetota bacterium]
AGLYKADVWNALRSKPSEKYLEDPNYFDSVERVIDVRVPTTTINLSGVDYQPGSVAIVPTDQPEFRFIESLMQRRQTFKENIFYDVSAWTASLALDVDVTEWISDVPAAWIQRAKPVAIATPDFANKNIIGLSIDPTSLTAPRLVSKLLRSGVQVRVTYDPFTAKGLGGRSVSVRRGSWLVMKATDPEKWGVVVDQVSDAMKDGSLVVDAMTKGLTPFGPDLGSNGHRVIPNPELLLVTGEGTSSLDSGSIWHTLDTRWEMPVTLVDAGDLGGVDLGEFTCVILPSGSYREWDANVQSKIESYVSGGGTVVGVGSAIGWLKRNGLVADRDSGGTERSASDAKRTFAGASDRAALQRIAGAIFETNADRTHPLAFGFPDESIPVFRTSTTRHALPANPLSVAAKYTEVLAGYVSTTNRKRLSGTAAVWAENQGSGRVICIADSPTFRGYFRSPERFLSNAILLGPTLRIPTDAGEDAEMDGHHHHD